MMTTGSLGEAVRIWGVSPCASAESGIRVRGDISLRALVIDGDTRVGSGPGVGQWTRLAMPGDALPEYEYNRRWNK